MKRYALQCSQRFRKHRPYLLLRDRGENPPAPTAGMPHVLAEWRRQLGKHGRRHSLQTLAHETVSGHVTHFLIQANTAANVGKENGGYISTAVAHNFSGSNRAIIGLYCI